MWDLFSNVDLLSDLSAASLRLSIPLIFAALGGVLCERSGVYNIGLEGMILSGAFGAAIGTGFSGEPVVGLAMGLVCGLVVGSLLAFLTVGLGVDQFVSGIAVNVLALGLTAFFARIAFHGQANTTVLAGFKPLRVCGLEQLPLVGPTFFNQNCLVYLMYLIVPAMSVLLSRTRWGLNIKAVGENPHAADAAGLPVNRIRFLCVVSGCALASLGGCYLVLAQVFVFSEHMSAGKGFVALAAVILGRWRPVGAFAACLFFGFCDALQLRLQFEHPDVPYQVFVVLPYLASILALVGLVGRSARSPHALGRHYTRMSR
jgi:simple sugar transport system permease protein